MQNLLKQDLLNKKLESILGVELSLVMEMDANEFPGFEDHLLSYVYIDNKDSDEEVKFYNIKELKDGVEFSENILVAFEEKYSGEQHEIENLKATFRFKHSDDFLNLSEEDQLKLLSLEWIGHWDND